LFIFLIIISVAGLIAAKWYLSTRKPEIRQVVLISIDTCRADYLSCYGYPRNTTPNLDVIAQNGIRFENVAAQVPLTLPSHSSMLTGTIPPYHGVHDNLDYRLGESNLTLAEILKQNGYKTAAIISAFVIDSKFGLDQGFDTYNDDFVEVVKIGEFTERRGAETTHFAGKWLEENAGEKFFLFLHYYDPHHPLMPPEPFFSSYKDNLYAGEIAYTDFCIAHVINKLIELGLYDSTLLIIVGDHGESLNEHDETAHGYFIYDATVKVPLIIRSPGGAKNRVVNDVVGLIDIVPTILSSLKIPVPPQVQGKDLTGYLTPAAYPKSADKRYIYCESLTPTKFLCNPLLGVVTEEWKYIQTTHPELYHLQTDPGETKNLIDEQPQRARLLQEQLKQILETHVRSGGDSKAALDAESIKKLESLGYVSAGSIDESFTFDQSKRDPKGYIHLYENVAKSLGYIQDKELEKAREICAAIMAEYPDCSYAYYILGHIASKEEDYETAVKNYNRALELAPDSRDILYSLGVVYAHQEKLDEAIKYWERVLELKDDDTRARISLASALAYQGKFDKAIMNFQEFLRLNPNDGECHANLADALTRNGQPEQALEHWKKAAQFKPDDPTIRVSLGMALVEQKQLDQAIYQYERSLQLEPNQPNLENQIAQLYLQQEKTALAIRHWKRALQRSPDWPRVLNNLAWILATSSRDEIRNPAEALEYAQKACALTEFKHPDLLGSLAAAYAANEKFTEAVETAQKALMIYEQAKLPEKIEEIQSQLKKYNQSQPYREHG